MNLTDILTQPVPDFTAARDAKQGYRSHTLLELGLHDDEPLVNIELYGIAGQSYYSRPNAATKQAVGEVDSTILLRESIAEKLAQINFALQESAEVAGLLGGPVELYIEEGYRSPALQKRLYDTVFPELIGREQPALPAKQLLQRRDELIAQPSRSDSPSPHATGAAIDLNVRYRQAEPGYVPGAGVEMGHDNKTSLSAAPDFYEHQAKLTATQRQARQNRRVFYWVMRGALLGEDPGFVVNPTEWWHWSYGDQLWAQLTNAPEAFFGAAKT